MTTNLESGYHVDALYKDALQRLKSRKDDGSLSSSDYNIITNTNRVEDAIKAIEDAISKHRGSSSHTSHRTYIISNHLLKRLEKFGTAIDVLTQSSPQVMGLNLVGLIWGSLRLLMIITRDIVDTFEEVLNLVLEVLQALPTLEVYVDMFGMSDIQLLKGPLTEIYMEYIKFTLLSLQLYDRSISQNVWCSIWKSLHSDFEACAARIRKAGKEVDRIANVEHMHQTSESVKNQKMEYARTEKFRQEIRTCFPHDTNYRGMRNQLPLKSFNDAPGYLLSDHFTGRSIELSSLEKVFEPTRGNKLRRCAVYGMPGLGKTQLALKYTALLFEKGGYGFIFWVSAASIQKLIQGFTKILNLVDHPDRYHPDQHVCVTMAKRWLETFDGGGEWLLVLDNVVQETINFIRDTLPRQNRQGNILFTTQNIYIARALVDASDQENCLLGLQVPSCQEAAVLLLEESGIDSKNANTEQIQKAEQLVKCVGCLPLAVSQAASFMTHSRNTLDDLLALYHSKTKLQLLSWETGLSLYEEGSVATTFRSRFDELERLYPNASYLLKVFSFLDAESLPLNIVVEGTEKWASSKRLSNLLAMEISPQSSSIRIRQKIKRCFRKRRPHPKDNDCKENYVGNKISATRLMMLQSLSKLITSPVLFEEAIRKLQDLSLVTKLSHSTTSVISIHELIIYMTQEMAMKADLRLILFEIAVTTICNAFPLVNEQNSSKSWPKYDTLVPHIESLNLHDDSLKANNPELTCVNMEVAGYFQIRARYADAEKLYRRVVVSQRSQLGLGHEGDLRAMHGLAYNLERQGEYAQAENIYEKARGYHTKLRMDEDLEALKTEHGLAYVYERQGRYGKAAELGEKVLGIRTRKLGRAHLDTLRSMHNLALVYGQIGKYSQAQSLFCQSLPGFESILGVDHLETLRTVHALANLYDRCERFGEAVELYERALTGRERQLGPDHIETTRAVCGLANLYVRTGLYFEAEKLYKRALKINEIHLPVGHPDTLRALHGLATVFTQTIQYGKAEEAYKSVITRREKVLGECHPDTLRSVQGLADVYHRKNLYKEAEKLCRRALTGREKKLGADHPESVQSHKTLASILGQQGLQGEANALV